MEPFLLKTARWPVISRSLVLLFLQVAVIGCIIIIQLADYIEWGSANFLLGLFALPLLSGQGGHKGTSLRFAWASMLLGIACWWLPVLTAVYMALGFAVLFLWEQWRGRVSYLAILVLVLMSPVSGYFAHVFSFPIRIWLTEVASHLLNLGGVSMKVAGNIMVGKAGEFSVDPACMGLNMLNTSLLCAALALMLLLKKGSKEIKWYWLVPFIAFVLGCNVVANLLRILILVYCRLLPDSFMHGFAGFLVWAIYVLLPVYFVAKWLAKKKAFSPPAKDMPAKRNTLVQVVVILVLVAASIVTAVRKAAPVVSQSLPVVAGYQVTPYDKDIIQLRTATAMIYLKPLGGFIYTDHNPLICWTGSGYHFESLRQEQWDGVQLYTGLLQQGKEQLYTAWWYDNGMVSTISQWTWRWTMLQGGPAFNIVNITAASPGELKAAVREFRQRQILDHFISR